MSEPVPSPGSADFIGDYQVLEALGRGGMGEVLLAWDERLQRRVAIKRIRHDGEVTPTLRQRLLREAQTVAGLSHSAIVHVYELLKDDAGDDCIVMEYVEGRTLANTLEDGPLEPITAVHLGTEIASGLAAAHEAGIVHRDLKAENVIVTPSGHAKILDFGLAKPLAPAADDPTLTLSGLVLGTCRSMSPEQARGAEVDERSDLFSLGVLLYEMVTGQPPFRGSGALEILTQVISKDPPRVDTIRPAIPTRLGNLIERLLEKKPASRPHSAAEVVRELEAIEVATGSSPLLSSEETISELPTGYHPLSQPLPRSEATTGVSITPRQRGIRIAMLIVLGILVLAAAVVLIRKFRQPDPSPAVSSRPSPPSSKVSDRDERTFREIERDIPTAEPQDVLARLTTLMKDSPDFVEAQLLAADMNLTLFESTNQSLYLKRAELLAQKAQNSAPGDDIHPRFIRVKVEIARGDLDGAEATFQQLQRLRAGDPQLLLLSSKIEESRGRMNDALDDLRQLVKERPDTWQNLYFLADLETRADKIDDARSHLDRILSNSPENIWVLERSAEIELLYGDLKKAALRYQKLIDKKPSHRSFYTNRGAALVLLGRYKEALEAFEQARTLQDDNAAVIINIADTELALHHGKKAREYYRKVLDHLDNLPGDSLSQVDQAARAQCLVHLDQPHEAKTAIGKALDRGLEDGNVLQAAALVYAVMGERDLAVDAIRKALKKDFQPRWFQLPAFDTLKNDPEYKSLMRKTPGATPSR